MIAYRAPTPVEGPTLAAMARASFAATFAHAIGPDALADYLDQAYGPDGDMARDLGDPAVQWRVAYDGEQPVGYIKLSAPASPYDMPDDAMEVRQLYVTEATKGTGVADALMEWAIATARDGGARELYLAVFDHNLRAVRFYARHGFVKIGSFTFYTGNQPHEDGLWRKTLCAT